MKRIAVYALAVALTLLIVLPVVGSVNTKIYNYSDSNSALFASGSPGPPPSPHATDQPTLVASGSPGPPLSPHTDGSASLGDWMGGLSSNATQKS